MPDNGRVIRLILAIGVARYALQPEGDSSKSPRWERLTAPDIG
jgi:hypothetical protein